MKIEKILRKKGLELLTVRPQDKVVAIAAMFEKKHKGLAVVCDDNGHAVGVLSLGDIVHAIGERGAAALDLPVRMIMSLDVQSCSPDEDVHEVVARMSNLGVRYLPVISEARPIALIEKREALEALYDEQALDFEQLRNYVFKTGGRY